MTPARTLAVSVVTLGIAGVVAAPVPATAAPVPCERAKRYAAQSGAQLFRLNRLDLRPTGRDGNPVTDLGVGDAKSAMVADAKVTSAAVTRMLDAQPAGSQGGAGNGGQTGNGKADGLDDLTEPVIQLAPPTNPKPTRRSTDVADAGPFTLGHGTLSSHARWAPAMACGAEDGEVTRAEAALGDAKILGDDETSLVAVPEKVSGLSTTALQGRGSEAKIMAGGSIQAGTINLLAGAVHVTIKRAPTLMTSMSTDGGGEVRYVPAVLEVSGDGIDTERLDTAGDDVEIAVDSRAEQQESASDGPSGALLPKAPLGGLTSAAPLPLPAVPAVPPVRGKDEAAQVTGPGTTLRISLGDVRQATAGHAVAARATAFKITITQGPTQGRTAQGYPDRSGVVLDLDVGVLEAAAVAPEPAAAGGGVQGAVSGTGGGLPITGPRVDYLAIGGVALLVSGMTAMAFAVRRGRFRP